MSKHVYTASLNFKYKTAWPLTLPSLLPVVLTIMNPDNAIYADVKAVSCHEGFDIHENSCYGRVTSNTKRNSHSCSKVRIMIFVIMLALLLGTAGACVAFALQITTLKSEIVSIQNTFTDTLEAMHKLNSSNNMLHQQLSQQNASIDSAHHRFNEKVSQQLNTTFDILYQQLSKQNASIDSSYQQLRQEYTINMQQQDTSTQLLFSTLENYTTQYLLYPSCAALPPSSPSGYYWVRASNGSAVSVYCDMTLSCGGVIGGWLRVTELDMTNSSHQCPSGLMERSISVNIRTCVRNETSGGCSSITNIITPEVQYTNVCGRVIGYQYGTPDAFGIGDSTLIVVDSWYVDGVSLTHGDPRQHIWTFAAATDEVGTVPSLNCPCTNTNQASQATPPPEFVGNDYFCDTGSEERRELIYYGDDPLWDGTGCGPLNTCCSFNTPPWFYKQLPQPTTDDIEMRVCRDQVRGNEDIAIEIVEVYVQ